MGDRCFMTVKCRREDKTCFEKLGFRLGFAETEHSAIVELVDEEANYAHYDELPRDIPFIAENGAGCNYGECKTVCDGKETVELSTDHNGWFVVAWNYRFGLPTFKSILHIRRFLRIEKRVTRLFKELQRSPSEHVFSTDTGYCIKCGTHADDDALENRPCIR